MTKPKDGKNLLVALDIGTSKVAAIVAENAERHFGHDFSGLVEVLLGDEDLFALGRWDGRVPGDDGHTGLSGSNGRRRRVASETGRRVQQVERDIPVGCDENTPVLVVPLDPPNATPGPVRRLSPATLAAS